MEQASNIFTDGLVTDSHPLTTPNNALTDALNATFRTHNGNELMIQNDMGNTTICDSTTGNIMGLEDGFVPVGMKEYGGILYIASYNLETKEGLLGTISSPVFNYDYKLGQTMETSLPLTMESSEADLYSKTTLYRSAPFLISTLRFNPGDLFIPIIQIDGLSEPIYRMQFFESSGITAIKKPNVKRLLYSMFSYFMDTGTPVYGLYRSKLLAKIINTADTYDLNSISSTYLSYYLENSFNRINSPYWFIDYNTYNSQSSKLDEEICQADNCYRTYPNILPGYLYCSIQPELIEDNVKLFINRSTNIESPITYILS